MKKIYLKIRRRIQYHLYLIHFFFTGDKILKKIKRIRRAGKKKEKELKLLYEKEKNHPVVLSEYASCKIAKSDTSGFDMIKDFETIRKKWLKGNNISSDSKIFLPVQQVLGSLGNYFPLYYYIVNHFYLEKKKIKPTLLLKETEIITNPEVCKFFLPFINVIQDNSKFYKDNYSYEMNKVPLESVLAYKNQYFPWPAAMNFINQEIKEKNISQNTTFVVPEDKIAEGKEKLAKFGISDKDWFVVLHIRDTDDSHKFRNSDPKTYLKAIKKIISSGGHVIRMGRKARYKFPEIKGLIDYPFSSMNSDFMDVFLASSCKFCIGTSSGYISLPPMFGKPLLLVNLLNTFEYFSYKDTDIFLPKTLVHKKNNKLVPLEKLFNFEIGNLVQEKSYEDKDIKIQNNTPEEILAATEEMLSFVDKKDYNNYSNDYNSKFKETLSNLYKNYSDYPLKPLANLPSSFLQKYYS